MLSKHYSSTAATEYVTPVSPLSSTFEVASIRFSQMLHIAFLYRPPCSKPIYCQMPVLLFVLFIFLQHSVTGRTLNFLRQDDDRSMSARVQTWKRIRTLEALSQGLQKVYRRSVR
jgi:hypothetical protein